MYEFDVQSELELKFKDTPAAPEISASKNRNLKRHTYIFGKFTAISGLISLVWLFWHTLKGCQMAKYAGSGVDLAFQK